MPYLQSKGILLSPISYFLRPALYFTPHISHAPSWTFGPSSSWLMVLSPPPWRFHHLQSSKWIITKSSQFCLHKMSWSWSSSFTASSLSPHLSKPPSPILPKPSDCSLLFCTCSPNPSPVSKHLSHRPILRKWPPGYNNKNHPIKWNHESKHNDTELWC